MGCGASTSADGGGRRPEADSGRGIPAVTESRPAEDSEPDRGGAGVAPLDAQQGGGAAGKDNILVNKIPAKTLSAPTAQGAWLQLQPGLSEKVKQLMEFAKKAHPIKISRGSATNELIKLVKSPETDFRLRTIAAQALVNLVQHEEEQVHNHTEIVRAGGLEAIMALLVEETTEIVRKEAAIVALENLTSTSSKIRQQLMGLQPLPYIVPLLSISAPLAVWCNAATVVVRNLAAEPENRRPIALAGAIAPTVYVLNTGSQNGGRGLAAAALLNLTCSCPENKAEVLAAGAMPELHEMVAKGSKFFALPSIALMAIWNIDRSELSAEVREKLATGEVPEGGRRDPQTGDFVLDSWRTTLFKY